MEKIGYFCVGRPVLDSGHWTGQRDSGTVDRRAVQYGIRDSGQWTVDSGQAILYWTDAARGRWTVDGTEWTEVLSLL